jgi:hypothetical protein
MTNLEKARILALESEVKNIHNNFMSLTRSLNVAMSAIEELYRRELKKESPNIVLMGPVQDLFRRNEN